MIAGFDPSLGAAPFLRPDGTTPRDVVARIDELIVAVDELFKTDTIKALGDLARDLGIGGALNTAFNGLIAALQQADAWLAKLEQPLMKAASTANLVKGFVDSIQAISKTATSPAFKTGVAADILATTTDIAGAVGRILAGLPRYVDEVMPVRDAVAALVETSQGLRAEIGGTV